MRCIILLASRFYSLSASLRILLLREESSDTLESSKIVLFGRGVGVLF